MPETPSKVLFYPVWFSTQATSARGTALCWGQPCDSPGEARRIGKARVDAGQASRSFVVKFEGGKREILFRFTEPVGARHVLDSLLELEDALDKGEQGKT